jgi:acyl carrier protein
MNHSITRESILDCVLRSVASLGRELGHTELASPTEETRLFGEKSGLDSMGLVTLIVDLEESVHTRFGKTVVIADERAMSRLNSPFRRVATLVDHLFDKLKN